MKLSPRISTLGVAALLATFAAGSAWTQQSPTQSSQVEVRHAAARLVIVAEPRSTVSVTIQHGSSRLPQLSVREEGGRIIVDGGLERPGGADAISCVGGVWSAGGFPLLGRARHDNRAVVVAGVGRVALADLPVITAHVPLYARLAAGGAVWGQVGETHSLSLSVSGCGGWSAGAVHGPLTADVSGSSDVRVADVASAHGRLSGSGDLSVGAVAGPVDLSLSGSGDVGAGAVGGPVQVSLSGSGDVNVARVDAPVRVQIASSGDVRIRSGKAPDVEVDLAGSGGFDFRGEAARLSARIVGSGVVRVQRVTGTISKSVVGSGEVRVGGQV